MDGGPIPLRVHIGELDVHVGKDLVRLSSHPTVVGTRHPTEHVGQRPRHRWLFGHIQDNRGAVLDHSYTTTMILLSWCVSCVWEGHCFVSIGLPSHPLHHERGKVRGKVIYADFQ
jgi:hypothetical protein